MGRMREGYRGLTVLVALNRDRFGWGVATIGAVLLAVWAQGR